MAVAAVPFKTVVDVRRPPAACSSVKREARAGRSALCGRGDDELEVAEIHQRVGRDDHVERFAVGPQIFGQLGSSPPRRRHSSLSLFQHAFREVDADPTGALRRDERPAEAGAAAGVQHVEPLRRLGPDASPSATRAGRDTTTARASLRSSPQNSRMSLHVSVGRARRKGRHTRPACAAHRVHLALRRAIPEIATASSIWPSVQCASASSFRASLCRGRSATTLHKHAAASSVRFEGVEEDAEIRVRVDVIRIEPDRCAIRVLPPRTAFPSPSTGRRGCLWAFA